MKKNLIFLLFCPIFLFSGIFEHLLDKDKIYIQENHFTCSHQICQTTENNIYDNDIMDDSIKIIKAYLDQNSIVYKLEIELLFQDEKKDGFYQAILDNSGKNNNIGYSLDTINDKYGNHTKVTIISKDRKNTYIKYFRDKYLNAMKKYKENNQK